MSRPFNARQTTTIATVGAVAAAALIAGVAVLLTGVPEVKAEPQAKIAGMEISAKADRLPVLIKGAACSALGWPHYERNCQFDTRRPADEMRAVRIIALR